LAYGFDGRAIKLIENRDEILRCCFIGNPDSKRASILKLLSNKGLRIDVFGHNWEKHLTQTENMKLYSSLSGQEYWSRLKQYRLQLNILREHNKGSHNMRTFEIPGVGGIMLSERTEEQLNFYSENKEAFYFSNYNQLIVKAKMILELPKESTNEIRKAAFMRTKSSRYYYENKLDSLLQHVKMSME